MEQIPGYKIYTHIKGLDSIYILKHTKARGSNPTAPPHPELSRHCFAFCFTDLCLPRVRSNSPRKDNTDAQPENGSGATKSEFSGKMGDRLSTLRESDNFLREAGK